MLPNEDYYIAFKWMEWYPKRGEEGYDGVHDGEFKGLKKDAPKEAVEAYERWLNHKKKGKGSIEKLYEIYVKNKESKQVK
ncbi:MAG: hypothetical protein IJI56_03145 [Firmicutes bacterium]|nr:hypothetical protein [Oscillospiraceae bacterium]MBR0416786.1 hypothetical protein [Bacillota bacterium]